MRLVDADELVKICRKGWKLFGFSDEKICHWVDEYDINAQPTIKAIPVEWIEKKLYCCDNINAEIFVKALIRDWENNERHGHWIMNDNGTYSCSECQSWIPNEQHYYARYCLFCGAKMDRKGEEDDGI